MFTMENPMIIIMIMFGLIIVFISLCTLALENNKQFKSKLRRKSNDVFCLIDYIVSVDLLNKAITEDVGEIGITVLKHEVEKKRKILIDLQLIEE